MGCVAGRWFQGSPLLHKECASWLDARPSSASPATKDNPSRRWPRPTLPPRRRPFAAASSSAVAKTTAPPMTRWPGNSTVIPAPWASGEHASPSNALAAWPTSLAAVLRGLFPPQDRHKVLVLATTKPADLGLPISHWSLEDLAIQILKEAHYRDMSRSSIQ